MALLALLSIYHLIAYLNELKLEPGQSRTIWIHSQNGNDDSALTYISNSTTPQARLRYSIEKYAEIGIIDLPDVNTIFSPFHEGTKVRDIHTPPFSNGLTIIDHNKVSGMKGAIRHWKVVSQDDENEVQLAVFRFDEAEKRYQLTQRSPPRIAHKGLNTFFEQAPLNMERNDILGLITRGQIASNKVLMDEMKKVLTLSGSWDSFQEDEAQTDRAAGSFSFFALLDAGHTQGEISVTSGQETSFKLPQTPVYGHLAWYRFTFEPEAGATYFRPSLAPLLLNANVFIGLEQGISSPWTPNAFSLLLFAALAVLAWLISKMVSLRAHDNYQASIAVAGIVVIFGLAKYYVSAIPGLQFTTIVAAYLMVFLLPGIVISRYYPMYGKEFVSGHIVLAFVLSLAFWTLPAIGFFLVKTSYWPVIVAAILLVGLAFLKSPPVIQQVNSPAENLSPWWRGFRFMLWAGVVILAIHTFFSSRFHAGLFDTFHHLSLMAKNFALPLSGDSHTNLYNMPIRSMAPYAYNYWGMLIGMVESISGLDLGTVYCVGSGLLVIFMFLTLWWLLGLFVGSHRIRITAFAIILAIYITRSLGIFVPMFQRSEFVFVMYGPSVLEFGLFAAYIVLGIRTIQSKRLADYIVYGGLSLATSFFHMEFIFFNCMVLSLLIVLSLRDNGKFHFAPPQAYLLTIIGILVIAGGIVTTHLALGKIVDANSAKYSWYYALRYGDLSIPSRFYYLFKDMLKSFNAYIWLALAIWGGLLLVILKSKAKNASDRLFRIVFIFVLLLFIIIYNPIAEMIFTPIITSWPLQRLALYLRALTLVFAAIVLSTGIAYALNLAKRKLSHTYWLILVCALPASISLQMWLIENQWLPQIRSTLFTATYNQGGYLDIAAVANLPEIKYLNEYSKEKRTFILVEKPYGYAIPSLSRSHSYYHDHYDRDYTPELLVRDEERKRIWKACLQAEMNCKSQLPDNSVLLVRNEERAKFDQLGYIELFKGRLFTILKV